MLDTAKMSARGQIVIPKGMREAVGAKTDTIFTMAVINGRIVMSPLDAERIRKDLEAFREFRRNAPKYSDETIKRVIKEVRQRRRESRA